MRVLGKTLMAGIAAATLIGAGAARAAAPATHTMTIRLPDGGIAHIRYSGPVAPKVTFGTGPVAAAFDGWASPLAAFHRVSLAMHREMATLLHEADAATAAIPGHLFTAALHHAPAGMTGYSMVSTMVGGHVCMRSSETIVGKDGHTKVVTHESGDCKALGGMTNAVAPFAMPGIGGHHLRQARTDVGASADNPRLKL